MAGLRTMLTRTETLYSVTGQCSLLFVYMFVIKAVLAEKLLIATHIKILTIVNDHAVSARHIPAIPLFIVPEHLAFPFPTAEKLMALDSHNSPFEPDNQHKYFTSISR